MKSTVVLIAPILILSGCYDIVGRDALAEKIAAEFSKAADDCLLDVRDRNMGYSQSPNCTARLSAAAGAYTDLPVQLIYDNEPVPRHAYVAALARSTAWSAAAWSNAFHRGDPITHLW